MEMMMLYISTCDNDSDTNRISNGYLPSLLVFYMHSVMRVTSQHADISAAIQIWIYLR